MPFVLIVVIFAILGILSIVFIISSCIVAIRMLFQEKFIKMEKGALLTPIDYYENRETGRKIVVIGVIHIGEQAYYNYLQSLLDGLDRFGYVVLYEMIQKLNEKELAQLTNKQKKALDRMIESQREMSKIIEHTVLKRQKAALFYENHWVNADMRMSDFIKSLEKRSLVLSDLVSRIERKKDEKKDYVKMAKSLNFALCNITTIFFIFEVVKLFSEKARMLESIILGERNQVACEHIENHMWNANIVTIWGAAHLPEINEFILRKGFVRTKREWRQAYHRDNLRTIIESKSEEKTEKEKASRI